ncbi:MAG: sulfotransferase domain-containing protein [Anaerolineales bacterium]
MIDTLMDSARLLRWRLRRLNGRQGNQRASLPILFTNSFPKSGTHLLTQVLAGFTGLGPFVNSGLPAVTMFEGSTGDAIPIKTLMRRINRFRPGDIGYGHLHAEPPIVEALCKPGMSAYFILRDPRDVVVSHAYYVTSEDAQHALKAHYDQLGNYEEQLTVSITGLEDVQFDFPDIAGRFDPYIGWLDQPEILVLHYEKFLSQREETLHRVLDHAIARGFAFEGDRDQAVETLSAAIDPASSPTFRKGKSGGWREKFTPAHKELFKQIAGDLLIRLGYEQDLNW